MANNLITLTHQQYYNGNDGTQLSADDSQYGNYQFIKVDNIVNDVAATYCGVEKMLEGTRKTDVRYHAYRSLQELSFDTFRSTKSMEIEIPPSLVMALPHDFVGYTKLVWINGYGIEHVIYPTRRTSNPTAYNQDGSYNLQFDGSGETTNPTDSTTWGNYSDNSSTSTAAVANNVRYDDTDIYDDVVGKKYGGSTEDMNINGTFYIDYQRGRIHFSSNLAGKTITLKYISDGVGTLQSGVHTSSPYDTETNIEQDFIVHKFAQEAMIKCILYGCMQGRKQVDHNMLALLKKERFAEIRKAKLRLSNIKLEEITQVLRGKSKWIKH